MRIDIDGVSIGGGNTLTIRSGAPGQKVIFTSTSATPSAIAGMPIAEGGNGAAPPIIVLRNPNGIAINAGGGVIAPSGLTVDTLGDTWTTGQRLRNLGLLDGGSSLQLLSAGIHGGGTFKGNAMWRSGLIFDASAGYQTADLVAPHLNTYSILVEAAANGQCWLCLINPLPVNMY